jgi:hypothetical protein
MGKKAHKSSRQPTNRERWKDGAERRNGEGGTKKVNNVS